LKRWNGEVSMKKLGISSIILDYIWKKINATSTIMLKYEKIHVNHYEGRRLVVEEVNMVDSPNILRI
jgi:hypothetical protein